MEPPRSPQQRKQDVLRRLEHDVDAWVATAGEDGPCLVPLSFLWDGTAVIVSTAASNPTGRNLLATGRARVAIGPTRDVVLIVGTAEALGPDPDSAEAFVTKTGFEPRAEAEKYIFFRIRPQRLQAWREVNELKGRTLIRDGAWVV